MTLFKRVFYKIAVAAIHPLEFTVFLQNNSCNKKYHSYQLWYPLGCRHVFIERYVFWRHELQLSIYFYSNLIISRWGEHLKQSNLSKLPCLLQRRACSHQFFRGLHGTGIFWHQLLIGAAAFFGRTSLGIWFFRGTNLFHLFSSSHSFIEVVCMFISRKEWQSPILWRKMYLFHGRFCNHPLLKKFFQQ